jgi:hypothetical protein
VSVSAGRWPPTASTAAAPVNREIVRHRGDVRRDAARLLEAFERCLRGESPLGGH